MNPDWIGLHIALYRSSLCTIVPEELLSSRINRKNYNADGS